MDAQDTTQERFKELLQDIYLIGQKAEHIETNELILEIKKKLSAVLEKKH